MAKEKTHEEIEREHPAYAPIMSYWIASPEIESQPIFFVLQGDKIQDLDQFCSVAFSGNLPFRLWGIPEPILFGENGRIVQAVDLVTGSKMSFEIYPEIICMHPRSECCRSSASRFFANMQQRFNYKIIAEDNDENIIVF